MKQIPRDKFVAELRNFEAEHLVDTLPAGPEDMSVHVDHPDGMDQRSGRLPVFPPKAHVAA